jgi:hypothetical protein
MTTDGLLMDLAGQPAPRAPAARYALETCAGVAEPWLVHHSLRAYFFAAAHAVQAGIDHDVELLFVAAMLHDLALTVPFDSHRLAFEEAGATSRGSSPSAPAGRPTAAGGSRR